MKLSSPRHFMTAVVKTGLQNSIPFIVTTNINGKEDHVLVTRIEFTDADGDSLVFALKTSPLHGSANISADGILRYVPERDFTGLDKVLVSASENIDAPGAIPHELSVVISIVVDNINDAPVLFFQNSSKNIINADETGLVDVEITNENTKHLVGTFWMTDVDSEDILQYFKKLSELSLIWNFTLTPPPHLDKEDEDDILMNSYKTITKQELWLYHLPNYTGSANMTFITMDRDNAYSRPIIIQVHVNQHVDAGLASIVIAVIVVSGVIILALIAAVTFRYYLNSNNKIRDLR